MYKWELQYSGQCRTVGMPRDSVGRISGDHSIVETGNTDVVVVNINECVNIVFPGNSTGEVPFQPTLVIVALLSSAST